MIRDWMISSLSLSKLEFRIVSGQENRPLNRYGREGGRGTSRSPKACNSFRSGVYRAKTGMYFVDGKGGGCQLSVGADGLSGGFCLAPEAKRLLPPIWKFRGGSRRAKDFQSIERTLDTP